MRRYQLLTLIIVCLLFYALTNYGGVRSSDNEIMFRTTEALSTSGHFAVARELELWPKFGLAIGKDGKQYSIFCPLQAIIVVPFVVIAKQINNTLWYKSSFTNIPVSHYVGAGFHYIVEGRRPPNVEPHALRFLVSFFNVFITTLAVIVFYLLLLRLGLERFPSFFTAIVFAFGTMMWPYAGTFFCEPLAILLILISLFFLIQKSEIEISVTQRNRELIWSGLALGLAICTHITALLFVPFFMGYAFLNSWQNKNSSWRVLLSFCIGLIIPIFFLAYHNYARFGNPLETGRWADPSRGQELNYGSFVMPWNALIGILINPGKSFLFFCPAILLGLAGLRQFIKAHRLLALSLLAAIFFRVLFIACRRDWTGGFCIGPRYLLMAIPILLIPLGYLIQSLIHQKHHTRLLLILMLTGLIIFQQWYFTLGEIFIYSRVAIMEWKAAGAISGDINDVWQYSPLVHLLSVPVRGPWWLQQSTLSNGELLVLGTVIIFLLLGLILYWQFRDEISSLAVAVRAPTKSRHRMRGRS